MKTSTIIDNYINGNLTDAKRQARRVSTTKLIRALMDDYGKSAHPAAEIAAFLKGEGSFQAACDAEHAERSIR